MPSHPTTVKDLEVLHSVLHPEWSTFLKNPYISYDIPTMLRITTAQFCVPVQARAYHTGLYIVGNSILSRDAATADKPIRIRLGSEVCLVEVFTNRGTHTKPDYHLVGWRFTVLSALGTYITPKPPLPLAMMHQDGP